MQRHFAHVPGADFLGPTDDDDAHADDGGAVGGGRRLAHRFGRKRLLVGATALYAVFGTAPMWLVPSTAIIASRVALGVTEAVLMTVSTTMIGDYYSGARREKFMSLQTTVSAASAFLLNTLGGLIAEHGWRAPYGGLCHQPGAGTGHGRLPVELKPAGRRCGLAGRSAARRCTVAPRPAGLRVRAGRFAGHHVPDGAWCTSATCSAPSGFIHRRRWAPPTA